MSKLIPLHGKHGEGKFAIVDDDKYDELSKHRWHVMGEGYAARGECDGNGRNQYILMHRQILGLGKGEIADHIDANRLNNTSANLRRCSRQLNSLNPNNPRYRGSHSSSYRGVCWDKANNKWAAQIVIAGRVKKLGRYVSEYDAHRAYENERTRILAEIA